VKPFPNASLLTPARSARRPQVALAALVAILAGAFGLFALVRWAIPSVAFIDHVTVVNPGVYDLEVEVKGADDDGWLGLGTVQRGAMASFDEVIDQGDQWVFRFGSGGQPGGEVTLSRSQLRTDGWRLEVPTDVLDRLRTAGVPPSASG
jgi:hypothetical protein